MTGTADPSDDAQALRQQIATQRNALGRDLEALGDHVSPGRMVKRRRAALRQRVRGVSDQLMGTAEATGDRLGTVGEGLSSAGDRIAGAPDAARSSVQGNPLAMGIISFGVGLVAASVLPSTRTERDLASKAEPALHQAAEGAGSMVRDDVEQLKPEVHAAVDQVKDHARDAVGEVGDHAHQATKDIRQQAQSEPSDAGPQTASPPRQS